MNVAVLGLGRMGTAVAGRLIDAGNQVTVWNRTPDRDGDLLARGAEHADSVSQAVAGAEVVLVSLSSDDAVRQVLLPDGKPVAGLDGVVVDCSTVAPTTSREEAANYPGRFIACPIAGAPQAVESGKALLIVGGAPGAVERAAPVLNAISESRQEAGDDAGTAAVIKLLSNYLMISGLAVLADAVAVAQASGFGKNDLAQLLNNLPVVAPALKNRIDGLIGDDHDGWFSVELGGKDLRLFAETAQSAGVQLGLADATRSRYHAAVELGLGDQDLSAVIETLRQRTVEA